MSQSGVGGFLERKAEGPAFGIAVACMVARASQAYSGGALVLKNILGPAGMRMFDGATGVGLAASCELLMSLAGRRWRTLKRERIEAEGRAGMSKAQRAALVRWYREQERLNLLFMLVGMAASIGAGFYFLASNASNAGASDFGAALAECAISLLLTATVFYLGVLREGVKEDPGEAALTQAISARSAIVAAATERIQKGEHTPQDVRLLAGQLPTEERKKFLAALAAPDEDDPLMTARDVAELTGWNLRRVQRQFAKLEADGKPILRDDQGRMRAPRSLVARVWLDELVSLPAPTPQPELIPAAHFGVVSRSPRTGRMV